MIVDGATLPTLPTDAQQLVPLALSNEISAITLIAKNRVGFEVVCGDLQAIQDAPQILNTGAFLKGFQVINQVRK